MQGTMLKNKLQEDPLPWDFRNIVKGFLSGRDSLLDMFAPNPELLSSLPWLPERVAFVDRGETPSTTKKIWRVNGREVPVSHASGDCLLPYSDGAFDIVVNNRGRYEISELARVLVPGGVFITQQIGGMNASDLCAALGLSPKQTGRNLVQNTAAFERAGFRLVDCGESLGRQRFYRVEDILFFIKHTPILAENFKERLVREDLAVLGKVLDLQGYFDCICHRYFLVVELCA
jgi:SAM-dependent methyltransferase